MDLITERISQLTCAINNLTTEQKDELNKNESYELAKILIKLDNLIKIIDPSSIGESTKIEKTSKSIDRIISRKLFPYYWILHEALTEQEVIIE